MELKIMSQRAVVALTEAEPGRHNVIFITSPMNPLGVEGSRNVRAKSRAYLQLEFDDITRSYGGAYVEPQAVHVSQALQFAEGKDELVVCCHAGVSRSSATAYVIKCREVEPQEALKILQPGRHWPNDLVVKLGSEALGKPEVFEAAQQWKAAPEHQF